ncbi:MAG TPA: hypothetical protein ENK50_11660 [Sedimenticola sp.]|nr:hypothetical protein [Sedimenticola sp.]
MPLLDLYLNERRRRFKAEVNRMTGGGMEALLADEPERSDLGFLLGYLHAFHWLQRNVPARYRPPLLAPFKGGSRAFLMELLQESPDAETFLQRYIAHWDAAGTATGPVQQAQLQRLLQARGGDRGRLVSDLLAIWKRLGLFSRPDTVAYSEIGRRERNRYDGMLSDPDRERLAMVDQLPDPSAETGHFEKLGVIPAMGCPQACRHCMFIWRPPMAGLQAPAGLYELLEAHTRSLLFTGGDLTHHLAHFHRAIRTMRRITTFAILLNGDFATTPGETRRVLGAMTGALRQRPAGWPTAHILLQISFDEFHQEVIVDRDGRLKERIPVARIANIVEAAVRHPEIQLALLHKQNHLNFSMDLFHKGVFGRLAAELAARGHQLRILSTTPSTRHKENPLQPGALAPLIRDAGFVLTRHPERPVLLTSSTIDAYGRAQLLEPGEAVNDRPLLAEVLERGPPAGEAFDTDLMFWFNGWVTLFSAVHIALGNLSSERPETIFARHRKDPLTRALRGFDRRLLTCYNEVRPDLERQIERATGPHQLFHALTEEADVRLHMTRRLIESQETT